jgi:putative transposase
VLLHAIGGTDDHVHLAVTVPPTLLVSEWIGEMKGASAHYVNRNLANRKVLEWQSGYGVVSFGTKATPWVIRYIENQREQHARRTTHERLERVEIEKRKPVETGSLEMGGRRGTGRKRPA